MKEPTLFSFHLPEKIKMEYQFDQNDTPVHTHDFIEFTYILSGRICHTINGVESILKEGDFALLDYGCAHKFTKTEGQECILVNCLFLPSFIHPSLSDNDNLERIFRCPEIQYSNLAFSLSYTERTYHEEEEGPIRKLVMEMQKEFYLMEFGYLKILRSHLIILLMYVLRYLYPKPNISDGTLVSAKVIDYMQKNYYKKMTLREIGERFHYTPQYLCSKFKKETNVSFADYLQRIRIGRSCELLQHTNMKIIDIANEVGYADVGHFEKVFRKHTERTPTGYRKFIRKN